MLKIGITGGIGSGKTLVCKVFELQGVPVFYADSEAKALMNTDPVLKVELINEFGELIYAGGILDRKKLASIVFNDDRRLQKLNSLVHPAVFKAFDNWVQKQRSAYVLKEAALLFESGSYKDCDKTILIRSPLQLRLNRVSRRDGVTTDEVLRRMAKQMSDEEKAPLADFIIDNNETELLLPQITALHQRFLHMFNR